MAWILFIIYFILGCFLLSRLPVVKATGIDLKILLLLFVIRTGVGFFNSYINLKYYSQTDVEYFHREGVKEYHLLIENPREYVVNFFRSGYDSYSGFTDSKDSFWNDTRSNIVVKVLSIFNVFSGGAFFINCLFFNFLIFFASFYLVRAFQMVTNFPDWTIVLGIFLLPSLVYYTSGVHRDGLIFICLCFVFYAFPKIKSPGKWKYIIVVCASLLFALFLRYFVVFSLLVALGAWALSCRLRHHPLYTFIGCYFLAGLLFFGTMLLPGTYNLPEKIAGKQAEFRELSNYGTSTLQTTILEPTVLSFVLNAPQAANHSMMRPYITEHPSILYVPLSVEIITYNLLFLVLLIFPARAFKPSAFLYAGIFFGLSMLLMIGYTIPILGAFIRYRSIFFPFLIIPILGNISWQKMEIKNFITKK